jgi:hypothetical protein
MDSVVNVEKLQRMNVLVRELERHGMSRDAAMQEAGGILSREQPPEPEVPPPMFPQSAAKEAPKEEQLPESPGSALLEAKYQYLFEQSFRKYDRLIEDLKSQLSRVTTELDMLRADVRQLAAQHEKLRAERVMLPPPAEHPHPEIEQLRQQLVNEPAVQPGPIRVEAPAPQPEKKQHPRQGNYKPEDVSMEKFFYFGHK